MSYNIIRSDKAYDDLRNILIYIAETNSPQVAFNYIDKLQSAIEKLKDFPELGKLSASRYLRLQNIRVLNVESHLIYYKVYKQDQIIKIFTIRHGRQNYIEI